MLGQFGITTNKHFFGLGEEAEVSKPREEHGNFIQEASI